MNNHRLMTDVSSNNGPISVREYSNAGHAAIAIKATEGHHYVNPFHLSQCELAHRLGLTVVHYHFCRPGQDDIMGELRNFRNTYLKGWRAGDYIVLDLEVSEVPNTKHYAESFLADLLHDTGHEVILYTYVAFAEEHLRGLRFKGNRWWLAKYSAGKPALPKGRVLFAWQYTDGSAGPQPHHFSGIGRADGSILNSGVARRLWVRKLRRRKK